LCGYNALSIVELELWDNRDPKYKDWIQESQDILGALKDNLQIAQNQQKLFVDRHMVDHTFEVGHLVFLRLQPFKQSSLNRGGVERIKPHFYGPYRVGWRICEVAYELKLTERRNINNVFHVSCLKKALGQKITTSMELPPLDEEV
jgi:hypothetical protein